MTNSEKSAMLLALVSNGFTLEPHSDGWFWVYRRPTRFPQYDWEVDILQVNYDLTDYTSLIDGEVTEETPEDFLDLLADMIEERTE